MDGREQLHKKEANISASPVTIEAVSRYHENQTQWVSFGRRLIKESIYSLPSARLQVDIYKQRQKGSKAVQKESPSGPHPRSPGLAKTRKNLMVRIVDDDEKRGKEHRIRLALMIFAFVSVHPLTAERIPVRFLLARQWHFHQKSWSSCSASAASPSGGRGCFGDLSRVVGEPVGRVVQHPLRLL